MSKKSIENIYPLTPLQEGILFHNIYDNTSLSYFEQISYRVKGELSLLKLEQSFNDLFSRHEVLRTVFNYKNVSRPVQIVLRERKVDFCFKDLFLEEDTEACIDIYKEQDKARGFDLSKDVLMRVGILKVDEKEFEFVWSFHHILLDGWSVALIISEFYEIYNTRIQNKRIQLPTVKPYSFYIKWLEQQNKENTKNYWKQYLEEYEQLAELPKKNKPSSNKKEYKNEEILFELKEEKVKLLTQIVQQSNVTLNTIIQAIWGILLGRYNNTTDVVFGAVVSGRPSEIDGIEHMVGLFINTIPVRVRYEEALSFEELIRRLQMESVDGEKHHYYSLADIQTTNSKQGLLDHILVFENYPVSHKIENAPEVNNTENQSPFEISDVKQFEQTNYDFNLIISPGAELTIRFNFNASIYKKSFVTQVINQFEAIIDQVTARPNIKVSAIDILTAKEKVSLIEEFTSAPFRSAFGTVGELFKKQAIRTPEAPAIVHEGVEISYKELNKKADKIAAYLKASGVQTEDKVAILSERSIEMITAVLGTLKAGAAIVPIDPQFPKERINYIIKDSRASVVLTDIVHDGIGAKQTVFREVFDANVQVDLGDVDLKDNNLLYIIYTSGTTGKPKGVMLEHRNMVNLIEYQQQQKVADFKGKVLQFTTLSFDVCYQEIFSTLLTGGCLYIIDEDQKKDVPYLLNFIEKNKIPTVFLPTAYLKFLFGYKGYSEAVPECLKHIITAGEQLIVSDLLKKYLKKTGTVLHNHYGPAETHVVTTYVIDKNMEVMDVPPIGKPISNNRIYILNQYKHLQPIGALGEIYIAGANVGRGYVNNKELTESKFERDPFVNGERMYRTGDLAKWLEDGNIEFIGRKDGQVKIRGYRIEVGEIESRLLSHKHIQQAVVSDREDEKGEKFLTAYIVADQAMTVTDIRKYLALEVPDYMIPTYVIFLEQIPLNANGKVDRRALPAPDKTGITNEITYEAPCNELQEGLISIWQQVLGRERIGIKDNFFEIGGHSLKATQVLSRVHKDLKTEIELKEIFAHPTVEELSKAIERKGEGGFEQIPPAKKSDYYSLSHAQKRLWLLAQMGEGNEAYNLPGAYELNGVLNRSAFSKAFDELIKRHESLRTTFKVIDGEPWQKIHTPHDYAFQISYSDLRQEKDREHILTSLVDKEASECFDLEKGPLLRGKLLQLEESKHLFVLTMHHIISDGWSMEVLIKEIAYLYNTYKSGQQNALKPLNLQYKDYAEWETKLLSEEKLAELSAFWKEHFADSISPVNLSGSNLHTKTFNGAKSTIQLSKDLKSSLKELEKEYKVTSYILLLSIFNVFLSKLSREEEITILIGNSGRSNLDLEDIIGLFIRTFGMKNYPKANKTFGEFLREVKERYLDVVKHDLYPLEMLLEDLNIFKQSQNIGNVFFQLNNLDLLDVNKGNEQLAGLSVVPYPIETATAKTDLMLYVTQNTEDLILIFEYNTDLFSEQKINLWATGFMNLIAQIISSQEKPLSQLRLSNGKEKELYEYLGETEDNLTMLFPLSIRQQDFYFDSKIFPNEKAHRTLFYSASKGAIEYKKWLEAIGLINEIYPVLQTQVIEKDGELYQGTRKRATDNTKYIDLSFYHQPQHLVDEELRKIAEIDQSLQKDLIMFFLIKVSDIHYVSVISIHHIISDITSAVIILRRLDDIYESITRTSSLQGGENQLQAFDDAIRVVELKNKGSIITEEAQQEYLFHNYVFDTLHLFDTKDAENYWKEKLKNISPLKSNVYITRAEEYMEEQIIVSSEHLATIKQYCKRNNISEALYFRAVYSLVIKLYLGVEEDFIINDIIHGRNAATKQTVGCFSIILPLVLEKEIFNNPISTYLQYLRNQKKEIGDRQYISVFLQKQILKVEGIKLYYNYQVLFNLKEGKEEGYVGVIAHYGKDEVQFSVRDTPEGLGIVLNYNRAYFDSSRFLERVIHVSNQLLQGAEELSKIDFNLPDELSLILPDYREEVNYPKNILIHELFENHASINRANIALSFEGQTLTYEELNQKSNQLAHCLRDAFQIQPDDLVGVLMDRSNNLIVVLLAILKAGGAYVPIDPAYPEERIKYTLADSSVKTLITDNNTIVEKYDLQSYNPLPFEENQGIIGSYSSENPTRINSSSHLAYIIYTSGSTGRPKGVMVEHKNVVSLLENERFQFEFGAKDVWTLFHSVCFDFSVWEIFGALLKGGKLIIVSKEIALNPDSYLDLLEKEGVTILNQTPNVFFNISTAAQARELTPSLSLRYIIFGGEALHPQGLKWWSNHYMNTRLINMYGITETTVHVTYKEIGQKEIEEGISNIGKAIPTLQLYVMDERLQILPPGIAGELVVSGEGVSRGYLNQELLTQSRFKVNPYNKNERIYLSGDLGLLLPDGTIQYIGRKDNQVKVRGYRIELGEIENAFLRHVLVEQSVIEIKGEGSDKQLVGYYTVKRGEALEAGELRSYLEKSLPGYMVPGYLIKLEGMPLTGNGKIDRKALPDPEDFGATDTVIYEAPRNELERQLVRIWEEVLGKEGIGIKDNFFEIGGHSLRATRVLSKISKELKVGIELRDIFTCPTIEELSNIIEGKETKDFEHIGKIQEAEYYEVSHAQRRLWVLSQFDEGRIYNIPGAYTLKGDLDRKAFDEAFEELVRRHETLRTTFKVIEGEPKQRIHSAEKYNFKVQYKDLKEDVERENIVTTLVGLEADESFDLEHGPLFRATLIQLEKNKYVFLLTMHHIISDGWSLEILVREVTTLYNTFRSGQKNPFKPLRIQYKDFAHWQNNFIKNGKFKQSQEYWLKQLSGELPVLNIPLDYSRPAKKTFNGAIENLVLDKELKETLEKLSIEGGTSLFVGVLTGIKVLLYRYTGQKDIIIGSPTAGRDHSDLEDQVGFYVNMLALRTRFEGTECFEELLQHVKQTTLEAHSHQHYPFDQLVEELNIERDLSRSVLYDVGFTWMTATEQQTGETGLLIENYKKDYNISRADLWFYGVPDEEGVKISVEYNTDLFRPESIRRLLAHFKGILSVVVKQKAIGIDKLDYLSSEEKNQLISEFNNTSSLYPGCTIQELFEQQVLSSPEAVAVVYDGKKITYKELNEQSNQLAHYLGNKFEIGPDDLIGIIAERSERMIVAILGILKSGGGYVPIDPMYPEERIRQMLDDSAVKVLLIESEFFNSIIEYYKGPVFALDLELEGIAEPKDNLQILSSSKDLAYVMYTSGSTGVPKGVAVEHKSVVRLVKNANYTSLSSGSNILKLSNYAFDGSVFDIFGALLNGGCLHIIDKEVVLSNEKLIRYIEKQKINTLFITTALFNNIVELSPSSIFNLDKIYFGGELCSLKHISKALEHRKHENSIVHVYGPTEGTTFSTYYEILKLKEKALTVPIGRPLSNTEVYILDDNSQIVPIGVAGELYIGGDGLAREYLNKEDLTRDRFVKSPFSEGERLYKTGDIGRWLEGGDIEFIGRKDNQVKVRGHRIELGEIENVMMKNEMVDYAVVEVRGEGVDKKLIGYYSLKNGVELNTDELRTHLDHCLPQYMIPAYLIHLGQMPLTINGKVNRKALPDPEETELANKSRYVSPRNALEEQLTSIWEEILGKERLGIEDNFFTSGGDSIKAIRLVSTINKSIEAQIEIKDIFLCPTIAELSEQIDKGTESNLKEDLQKAKDELESIKLGIINNKTLRGKLPLDWEDIYPMSAIQEGMIFHSLFDPDSGVYIDQLFYQIEDTSFNYEIFKQSISLLVDKHSILRTSFYLGEFGSPIQVVHKNISQKLEHYVENLSSKSVGEQRTYLQDYLLKDRQKPFILNNPGLWRMKVFQISEKEYGILLVIHHAIIDGWSVSSLMTELSNVYFNLKEHNSYRLNSLKANYKDYISEQLFFNRRPEISTYWQKILEEYVRTPLPFLKPIGETSGQEYKSHTFKIAGHLVNGLIDLSHRQQVGLKEIFLSAFIYLLKLTSGTKDITIGLVSHGRPEVEDGDKIIGCFLNTVPFRVQLEDTGTSLAHINRIKALSNTLKSYDKLPLPEIVRLIKEEVAGHNPIFDIIFNYLDFHITNETHQKAQLKNSLVENYTKTNTYLDFNIFRGEKEFSATLLYLPYLYKQEELARISTYYKKILECFLEEENILEPNKIIGAEELRLLQSFNYTTSPYPKEKTIQELFEIQVEKAPNAVAVAYKTNSFTYQQLNEKANQLAHYLREKYDVKPDDLVGIIADRSEKVPVSMLGILKSGAGYLPLDPNYPVERLIFALKDAQVKAVITDRVEVDQVFSSKYPVIFLDEIWDRIGSYPKTNLNSANDPKDLAYVMYTSGSTGEPKGVSVEHQSVVRLIKNTNYFHFQEDTRLLQTGAFAFDATTFEIWGSLLNGGSLLLLSQEALLNSASLKSKLLEDNIDVMWLTSSWFNQLADLDLTLFAKLKYLLVGGEKLSPKHIMKVKKAYPALEIINGYGPTEGTTFTCCYSVKRIEEESLSIPIGKPISNTEVYILDEAQKLVPINVPGELYIGGDGLARGYLNREELTKEKFIESPFEADKRLYKTGDIGKWLEDGNIEFIGRKDGQVKVRGHRIELGEIEATLSKHPSIKQVIVELRGEGSEKHLVGYYTTKVGGELGSSEVKTYLGQYLPGYMVPNYLVELESVPLTSNGKVDRKSLPDPEELRVRKEAMYEAPRNELEEQLTAIWQEVLGKKKIGIKDHFFEIGGHSLKATQVQSRIHKDLNCELGLKDIFTYPTIEELSKIIKGKTTTAYESIEPVVETEFYEISHAQKRLWILDQFEEVKSAYNIPGAYELKGALDGVAFENSFQELIKRHESLRTTFKVIQGEVRQKVHLAEEFQFKLQYNDLQNEEGKEDKALTIANEEVSRIFDLENGPLISVRLVQLQENRFIFLLTMHHIISDGWSMEVLVKEIISLYNSFKSGQENTLQPLRIQYKDYAAWQKKQLSEENIVESRQYWFKQLGGDLPILNLPSDYPRPVFKSFSGASLAFELDKELKEGLKRLGEKEEASLFMVLLSSINTLLFKYTGQEDIIIGSPIAGRTHHDLENQVGFYVNTLALRTGFSRGMSFNELLRTVKNNTLAAYEHQHYPFDRLVEELDLNRDLSRSALFDVMLVLQNATSVETRALQMEGIEVNGFKVENLTSKYDLTITFFERDVLVGNIEYNTSLFLPSTIGRLIAHYKELIASLIKDSGNTLKHLKLLPSKEEEYLKGLGIVKSSYPLETNIHELFELQVAATPHSLAVAFDDQKLTYQELSQKANQLAHYLRERYDIKSDDLLGILADRSERMIIGILGILKSGAGYLPLDPAYPKERLGLILKDARVRTIITDTKVELTEVIPSDYKVVNLEEAWPEISDCPQTNPLSINSSRDIAYVMYTSGSTGEPKGVVIEHRSVLRLVKNTNYINIKEGTKLLQTGAFAFDATTFEIWGSLLNGGELHLLSQEALLNISSLKSKMLEAEIDMMWFTASWFNQIVDMDITVFGKLKYLLVGGEKLSPKHIGKVKSAYKDLIIINGYGPTEGTTFTCCYKIDEMASEALSIPIGRPINNTEVYLLNEDGQLVAEGVVGELYIGGDGLARGYLNREELTREKFIENLGGIGSRLYKTGDMAKWLQDGNIEFVGRKDNQVKVRGHRIELGEIQSILVKHLSVGQAHVELREGSEKQLVGYYTVKAGESLLTSALKAYLGKYLPEYMIPAFLIELQSMPITANGKIDRKALLAFEELGLSRVTMYEAPRNKIEAQLVTIWQEVLGRENIGIKDNFFEIGGHSLKATQVLLRVIKELQVEIEFRTLFTYPTIEELASIIQFTNPVYSPVQSTNITEEVII